MTASGVRTVVAVASHPIQYQVPWYRHLTEHPACRLRVLYGLLPDADAQGIGFDRPFQWDTPLLEGYSWEVLPNRARRPSLGGFLSSNTPTVTRRLRELAPDAVLVTGWHQLPLVQALRACRRLKLPCVLRGEANDLRPRPHWKRWLQRRLVTTASAVLSIGEANESFYLTRGVPPDRIFRCPYFVDNEWFVSAAENHRPSRASIRSGWGISPEVTCVLFAGKLIAKKNPEHLMAAAQAAHEGGARIHLLIAGSGPLEATLRQRAVASALPVTFAGFLNQSEMPRAYAAADLLALPSDAGETWGLVVNEAMASGVPAVVSDRVGCSRDLIVEGRTGEVFPCGDIPRLAQLLDSLSSEPARLARMGGYAQAFVRHNFSVARASAALMAAVDTVKQH